MQHFVSDISHHRFPMSEKVHGSMIRAGVMATIRQQHPGFDEHCVLSLSELNNFRQQYIQGLLSKGSGTLSALEKTVMNAISGNGLISNEIKETESTLLPGERWADRIASFGGSWKFIGLFSAFIFIWMVVNIIILKNRAYDPYPFILLNLILSCIAALQAPVIMMSQNRQEQKDRERAANDYMINLKSELEIRMLHEKIDHLLIIQQENLLEIQQIQVEMMREMMEKINKTSS